MLLSFPVHHILHHLQQFGLLFHLSLESVEGICEYLLVKIQETYY